MRKRFFKDGNTVHPRNNYIPKRVRNKPTIETSTGIKVRSQYEKTVIEFFSKLSIACVYEPLLHLDGRQYRPDFFLGDHNLFIEICGMTYMPNYRDRIKCKEDIYKKHNLNVLFIIYSGKGSLTDLLSAELNNIGIVISD